MLGYRWPLAALTFALAIYGGVITWLLFLANSDRLERMHRLDAGPTDRVEAEVSAIEDLGPASHRTRWVEFEFRAGDQDWPSRRPVPDGTQQPGDTIEIEFLRAEPSLNRIVGAPQVLTAPWLDHGDSFAMLVVPGLLIGLAWLAGVLHLRRVLAHGDVGVAQVLDVRPVRWCLPESYSVRFRFRDHHAHERTSRHWVRAHSPLGQRLLTMMRHSRFDRVPVLHDRRFPQHCRLVLPEDFGSDANAVDPAATIRL